MESLFWRKSLTGGAFDRLNCKHMRKGIGTSLELSIVATIKLL